MAQTMIQSDWQVSNPGIILGMGSSNERRRYYVTPSLIGWAHTQNDPCNPQVSLKRQAYIATADNMSHFIADLICQGSYKFPSLTTSPILSCIWTPQIRPLSQEANAIQAAVQVLYVSLDRHQIIDFGILKLIDLKPSSNHWISNYREGIGWEQKQLFTVSLPDKTFHIKITMKI